MNKRLEFSDKQKAEIFARDHAVCAFSGKSLWLLDYHLCPTYDIDWVDHIKPAMKGGGNEISNGVCASAFFNSKKKDNSYDNLYFFFAGKPTENFFYFYEFLPENISQNLKRLQKIHWTDWYLNRAYYMFLLALDYKLNPYLKNGKKQKRDDIYYSKACLKRIIFWKKQKAKENILEIEKRGLISNNPSPEQSLLLKLSKVNNLDEVFTILDLAFPIYKQNCDIFEKFLQKEAISKDDLQQISEHMKKIILQNNRN